MAEADEKRPQFGNRFLVDQKKVFEHNAWDNVSWDEEQEEEAKKKVANNSTSQVIPDKQEEYERDANRFWDAFYDQHQNRFFKDRHWLFTEFPELSTSHSSKTSLEKQDNASSDDCHVDGVVAGTVTCGDQHCEATSTTATPSEDKIQLEDFPGCLAKRRYFEVGCGVGNTVFPVIKTNNDPDLFMYCCDLSQTAIQLVKEHSEYSPERCHAFVCDVSDPDSSLPFPTASLDIIILIFVLSAIHPNKMQATVSRLAQCLKPGGRMLFRDYGRYDLAQLRFKDGQCLTDNFYVRGDGTRVYFFTQDELRTMFTTAGLQEEQSVIDRRLQVNRGRQLKMYRVWVQCKYIKPMTTS